MLSHDVPTLPWQMIGVDLFHHDGHEFLIVVDYYSFFFQTKELRQATAATVISACTEIFATHGLPVRICSDNGPPFSSKAFKDVFASLQIQQVFSSPYHPRSNGMAERAVQEAKKLLIKCSRDKVSFCLALLERRNTPRDAHRKSPVQRLMGRQTRTLLPVTTSHMKPETVPLRFPP